MMQKSFVFSLILIFVFLFPSFAGYDPLVRLDPAVEALVHRFHSRYGLLPLSFHVQPLSNRNLRRYLDSLGNEPSLSLQEKYAVERLATRLGSSGGVFSYIDIDKGISLKINLDLLGDVTGRVNDDALLGKGIMSPLLSGNIGKFSFYSALDVWTEYQSDSVFAPSTYQPHDGVPYNLYDRGGSNNHLRSSDLPRGGISYDAGRIGLETAIDYLKFGPAVHFPLTLSGQAPPVTYFRAMFDLGIFNYQHIAGLLRSQKDKPKYMYAHRLSGTLFRDAVHLGINEVIIGGSTTDQQGPDDSLNSLRSHYYGEQRDWEWAYFIPFVPFTFVEHYIGDRDNAALSFDLNVAWPRNFRLYCEFFLDDFLSPWKMFTDDFGNKWAITAGMQYFTSIYNRDVGAGIEYSRIEPWVYTHFYGGSHRYDHFDKPLGSSMGPNSQAVIASCDIRWTNKITAGFRVASFANNPDRGGKIIDVFQDFDKPRPDSETKKFLNPEGMVHHFRPGIYGSYDPFGIFKLNGLLEIDLAENRGQVSLRLDGGLCF